MRITSRDPLILLFLLSNFILLLIHSSVAIKQSYVVYLGAHSHGAKATSYDHQRATDSHYELLGSFLGSEERAKDAIFYSYTRYINGFAANLEGKEAMEIAKHSKVVSVFPNKGRVLHTTRSWKFLRLERDGRVPARSIWNKARFGEDVIVGNLDTGVWPESESFNDEGLGPIPSKWRGTCQSTTLDKIHCNRKLIGVRYFKKGYEAAVQPLNASLTTARDIEGHGTHTLSTAAGRFVPNASVLGFGNGTAKGGAPLARVAAYKVCWTEFDGKSCFDADIIAAFDAAIHDGLDVISASLGSDPISYFDDGIAIGSFHAVRHGITVVCSAGNSGKEGWVANTAPWIVTVAASTMDREFTSYVEMGNQQRIKGESLSDTTLPEKKQYPLIKSEDAKASDATEHDAQFCAIGSLDPQKVKGRIVVCLRGFVPRVEKGKAILEAGGVGLILVNDSEMGNDTAADVHVLPATHLSAAAGASVYAYINSTNSPTAYITPARTQLGTKPAPVMAPFSSMGPNSIVPKILKPDITAPGVNIIAAFSQAVAPSQLPFDTRRASFVFDSGTSMACPHIAGIACLLKAIHPNWSPAAIRSAIMTTASIRDNTQKAVRAASLESANPFSYGAGHVRPNRAMDPGLVYDLTPDDYQNFLCSMDYQPTELELELFTNKPYTCPDNTPDLLNFNYPSITIPSLFSATNVTRTLKNVGPPSTYKVRVTTPTGVSVKVEPASLKFEKAGDEKMFTVSVEVKGGDFYDDYVFGKLAWSDGIHHVRSPLVVRAMRVI